MLHRASVSSRTLGPAAEPSLQPKKGPENNGINGLAFIVAVNLCIAFLFARCRSVPSVLPFEFRTEVGLVCPPPRAFLGASILGGDLPPLRGLQRYRAAAFPRQWTAQRCGAGSRGNETESNVISRQKNKRYSSHNYTSGQYLVSDWQLANCVRIYLILPCECISLEEAVAQLLQRKLRWLRADGQNHILLDWLSNVTPFGSTRVS